MSVFARGGARSAMIVDTAFGPMGAGFTGGGVARVWLPGLARRGLEKIIQEWVGRGAMIEAPEFSAKLQRYFEGGRVDFDEPVDFGRLSGFTLRVLKELRNVGWDEALTYGELAERAGAPGAARAVGRAMAKNPVPLIVPCHRVVRADGGLGGFTTPAGVELKREMLKLEGHDFAPSLPLRPTLSF
ncbi:MAG: methylated-DNA--[protein]-cysteine S-methyltransferase [Candidatus Nitrospinota bacterium M3_3B_026]